MTRIIRKAKKEWDDKYFENCLDRLGLEPENLWIYCNRVSEEVTVEKCLNVCTRMCNRFIDFRYIAEKCSNNDCSVRRPCSDCRTMIVSMKFFYSVIKTALPVSDKKRAKRLKRYINWMNSLRKKS